MRMFLSIHFGPFRDDSSEPVAAMAIRRAVGLACLPKARRRQAKAEAQRQRGLTHGHAFTSFKRGYSFGGSPRTAGRNFRHPVKFLEEIDEGNM